MEWISKAARLVRALLVIPALSVLSAQAQDAKPFAAEQLDQMTAQVALYPDSLLAQLFMATTYPDDLAAAAAWSKAHPDAKGDDAVKMVENEPWDPSVASMVAFPEVLITLGDKPDWVRNMGDAFLAQPEDVMDSVQRLRQKAQAAGNLKSNEQVKVSTQPAEPTPTTTVVQQSAPPPQVIVIEPAQPSVVYVPAYNPTVVYGAVAVSRVPAVLLSAAARLLVLARDRDRHRVGRGHRRSPTRCGAAATGAAATSTSTSTATTTSTSTGESTATTGNRANWNHNPEHRGKTPYRGGDQTRQRLDKKHQAGNREQYRGRDASRDANRERAARAMQDRGVDAGRGSARDRAQTMQRDRSQQRPQTMNRSTARDRAQGTDRSTTRDRAQSMDRSAARDRAQSMDRSARARSTGRRRTADRDAPRAAAGPGGKPRQRAAGREQPAGARTVRPRRGKPGGRAARARRWGQQSRRWGQQSRRWCRSRGGGAGARARGGGGGRSGGGGGRGGGGRGR